MLNASVILLPILEYFVSLHRVQCRTPQNLVIMDKNISGFLFPVFSVRDKQRRINNFIDLDDALKYRNSFPDQERDRLSLEIFEYGF